MAKPEALPENGVVPVQKPVRPFDGSANAAAFHTAWGKLLEKNPKAQVQVPGSRRSVEFTKVEVDGKTLSIWTGTDTTGRPAFVIVNPPTEALNASGELVEDPLTAIALLIDGASN